MAASACSSEISPVVRWMTSSWRRSSAVRAVEGERAEADHVVGARRLDPAQDGGDAQAAARAARTAWPDSRRHRPRGRAMRSSGRAARGQQQDRHLALAAQLLGQRQAVLARHHDVEHDQVEGHALGRALGLGRVGGGGGEVAVLDQVAVQQLAQPRRRRRPPGCAAPPRPVSLMAARPPPSGGAAARAGARPPGRAARAGSPRPRWRPALLKARRSRRFCSALISRQQRRRLGGQPQRPLAPVAARAGSCSISPASASRCRWRDRVCLLTPSRRAELGQGDARAGARSGTAPGGRSRRSHPRARSGAASACS